MRTNAPRSLESTGRTDTDQHEQTYLTNFGFVRASQRRLDDLDVNDDRGDQAAAEDQEADR